MDDRDLHPADDYSHRFFIWHEWIQETTQVHGPLTTENVFDYFATSMFYDKQSNNQYLRMQNTGTLILNEAEELKRLTGIQFALAHASPPSFFIIHKHERLSPDQVRPLAVYFIVNNRIYQSPDVYTLLSNRLLTSLNALQSSLDLLRRHRPDYTPRSGFVWPVIDSSQPDVPSKKPSLDDMHIDDTIDLPEKLRLHAPKKQQNNSLMIQAMRTTAIHSNINSSRSQPLDQNTNLSTIAVASTPTPAVSSQKASMPRAPSAAPSPRDPPPVKGPPAAGKKKKKRTSALVT